MAIQATKMSQEAYAFLEQNAVDFMFSKSKQEWVVTIPSDWKSKSSPCRAWRAYGTKTFYWPPDNASLQIGLFPPMDGDPSEIGLYKA